MSEIITSKAKWLELIGEIAVIIFFSPVYYSCYVIFYELSKKKIKYFQEYNKRIGDIFCHLYTPCFSLDWLSKIGKNEGKETGFYVSGMKVLSLNLYNS